MTNFEQIEKLYDNYKLDEAEELLDSILENDYNRVKALVLKGKIYSRRQDYGKAINMFNMVIEIDAENKDAIIGLKLISNILKLSNNYYFENPYTDDDLYNFDE